jgi:hypothetical protein
MTKFNLFNVPVELRDVLDSCPGYTVAKTVDELIKLATRDADATGWQEVAFDVPGRGRVVEARACKVSNGIAANYLEEYMRRRDPDCMVIGDTKPTNKPTYRDRYNADFADLRQQTLAWLKTQKLALFPFVAGGFVNGIDAVVVAPENCGFFALGLTLISKVRSSIDLSHILFGNVLGISSADIHQTAMISLLVITVLLVLRKDLILFCFDPTHARSMGIHTGVLHYLLLAVLSLAAVAGLQTVGIILVVAMLVTPGATAHLLTDRFDRMTWIAVGSAMLSSVIGIYWSYWMDASTGGCIVVVQTLLVLISFLFAPRHGLVAQLRQ